MAGPGLGRAARSPGLRASLTSMAPFSRTSTHQCVGSSLNRWGSLSAEGRLQRRGSSLLGLKREPESPYSISSSSSTVLLHPDEGRRAGRDRHAASRAPQVPPGRVPAQPSRSASRTFRLPQVPLRCQSRAQRPCRGCCFLPCPTSPARCPSAKGPSGPHLMSWMGVSVSDWLLKESSSRELDEGLSVVNIPLTSRYTQSAITFDCCRERQRTGLRQGGAPEGSQAGQALCTHSAKSPQSPPSQACPLSGHCRLSASQPSTPGAKSPFLGQTGGARFGAGKAPATLRGAATHVVQLGLLQGEAVRPAPVGVALQHEHRDLALGAHDHHVGVGHRAVHNGRAQVHRDEVQLVHCKAGRASVREGRAGRATPRCSASPAPQRGHTPPGAVPATAVGEAEAFSAATRQLPLGERELVFGTGETVAAGAPQAARKCPRPSALQGSPLAQRSFPRGFSLRREGRREPNPRQALCLQVLLSSLLAIHDPPSHLIKRKQREGGGMLHFGGLFGGDLVVMGRKWGLLHAEGVGRTVLCLASGGWADCAYLTRKAV